MNFDILSRRCRAMGRASGETDARPCFDVAVDRFSNGQYVELSPTIPSPQGGSVESGTRGIVREVDESRGDGRIYLVAFLRNERMTGETAWLRGIDLFPA